LHKKDTAAIGAKLENSVFKDSIFNNIEIRDAQFYKAKIEHLFFINQNLVDIHLRCITNE